MCEKLQVIALYETEGRGCAWAWEAPHETDRSTGATPLPQSGECGSIADPPGPIDWTRLGSLRHSVESELRAGFTGNLRVRAFASVGSGYPTIALDKSDQASPHLHDKPFTEAYPGIASPLRRDTANRRCERCHRTLLLCLL